MVLRFYLTELLLIFFKKKLISLLVLMLIAVFNKLNITYISVTVYTKNY